MKESTKGFLSLVVMVLFITGLACIIQQIYN